MLLSTTDDADRHEKLVSIIGKLTEFDNSGHITFRNTAAHTKNKNRRYQLCDRPYQKTEEATRVVQPFKSTDTS